MKLRGESISGQLDGTIPSTSAEQSGSDALIDASHIDLEVMGSMDIGGGGGFGFGGQGGAYDTASSVSGGFDMSQLPEGFDPSEFGGGELPEDFDPSDIGSGGLPEGFDPSGTGEGSNPSSGEQTPAESAPAESAAPGGGETGGGEAGGAPSFGSFPGAGSGTQSNSASALAQYAIALAIFAPRPNLRPPLPPKTKAQINKAPPPGGASSLHSHNASGLQPLASTSHFAPSLKR